MTTISQEINSLRQYLEMPPEEVPADWQIFVHEYQRQVEDAARLIASGDWQDRRRGYAMQKNLRGMRGD